MSIKRISRMRVADPITGDVDEEPLATSISTNANGPDNARTGGNVETKASPQEESAAGSDIQSRVGTNIDTRIDTNVETRFNPK